jgi:hypothetical protein
MNFKSGYFCGFCQKQGCLSDNLQYCERCEIAIYCTDDSKKCKDQDWENHKSICGKVTYLQSLIPRIERNFYDFDLRSVPDEGIRLSSSHVFTILESTIFFSRNFIYFVFLQGT